MAHVGGKKERFFGSDRMELLAHTMGECVLSIAVPSVRVCVCVCVCVRKCTGVR